MLWITFAITFIIGIILMSSMVGGYRNRHMRTMMAVIIILTPFVAIMTYNIMQDGEISFDLFDFEEGSVASPYEEPIIQEPVDNRCEVRGSNAYIEHKSNSAECDGLEQDGYEWVTWCEC